MTTLIYIDGSEHGVATPVTSGGGLYNVVSGAPAVQGTIKRTGDYALQCNAAGTAVYVSKTISTQMLIVRLGVYLVTLPVAGNLHYILTPHASSVTNPLFGYSVTQGKFFVGYEGATGLQYSSQTPAAATWYFIDLKFDLSTNSLPIDWRVDGTAQTQCTATGGGAFTAVNLRYGVMSATTINVVIDDLVASYTSGDYPIGAGGVAGLRPNADGTHNNAANIMEDSAGNDIDGVTYFAFDKLDENPWTSAAAADYVRQTANGTANYCEINFADTAQTTIKGVVAILQYASATATSNNGGCTIIDEDATVTTLWGAVGALADYSEITAFYKRVNLPTPAGGWDMAAVNALKCRFGYSGDASPDPYWLAIMLEVAYAEATGPYTYEETGTGVSIGSGSGPDQDTAVETGQGITILVGSGVKLHEINKTIQAISILVGSGAKIHEITKAGNAISAFVGNGADISERVETATAVSILVGTGADVSIHAETGNAISVLVASGAKEYIGAVIYEKAGGAVSIVVASGEDAHEAVETGWAISILSGLGADIAERAETGGGISILAASGADVLIASESGGGVMILVGSGAKEYTGITTYTKAGGAVAIAVASGFDIYEAVESGGGISIFVGSGVEINYALYEKAGGAVSIVYASGADALVFGETGGAVIVAIATGEDAGIYVEYGNGQLIMASSGASVKISEAYGNVFLSDWIIQDVRLSDVKLADVYVENHKV